MSSFSFLSFVCVCFVCSLYCFLKLLFSHLFGLCLRLSSDAADP